MIHLQDKITVAQTFRILRNLLLLAIFSGCLDRSGKETENTNLQNVQDTSNGVLSDTIATRHGVYSSFNAGITWHPASNGLPDDVQVSFLAKKGDEIVMATDNHGLFMTVGGRSAWENIGKGLPGKKITALFVSEEEIYVGLFDQGIFKRSNNGGSWVSLNQNLPNLRVRAITRVDDRLIVATDLGIYKTKSDLMTWEGKFTGEQISTFNQGDGKIIAGGVSGVLLSSDGGGNWHFIHREGAVNTTALIEEKIFTAYIYGEVYSSGDWGESWVKAQYAPNWDSYVYDISRIGDNLMLSNNYGVFRSHDWGMTWKHIYHEKAMVFMDFVVFGDLIYGGTRKSRQYRNRHLWSLCHIN